MTPNLLISQPSHITEHNADIISQSQHPDSHLLICLSTVDLSAVGLVSTSRSRLNSGYCNNQPQSLGQIVHSYGSVSVPHIFNGRVN